MGSNIRQSPVFFDDVDFAYITQSDFEAFHEASLNLRDDITGEFALDTFAVTDDVVVQEEPGFIDKFGNEFDSVNATLTWRRNTLNRGILATRGNSQTLSLETTIPGSELEYYKILFEAQQFAPLGRGFTLRFRTKLGWGDGYGDMDELPFFENFRTGGIGSVRGFEPFTLGPLNLSAEQYLLGYSGWQDLDNDGNFNDNEGLRFINGEPVVDEQELLGPVYVLCEDPGSAFGGGLFFGCDNGLLASQSTAQTRRRRSSGGNSLFEFSTELILPIPFAEDTRSMQLVAFFDSGNVFSADCRDDQINCSEFDLGELRSSYGFGFKWLSGFGPMTFSLAWPTDEKELDDTKRFQFSFGAGF